MKSSSLTIRNIPEAVMIGLRERAKGNRRSMQGEILAVLEAAALETAPRLTGQQVLERIRGLGLPRVAESVDMIRSDRDGR